ncbi:MAG: tetratricopeptide repeat protein [Vampirovibrionales bacterium]
MFSSFLNTLKQWWLQLQQYQSSIEAYEKASASNGASPAEAFMHQGLQLAEAGDPLAAMEKLEQALHILPTYADAWANMGVLLAQQEQLEEAEAALVKALELDEERPSFWTLLGALQLDAQKPNLAEAAYQRAIALQPFRWEPWLNWAIALGRHGYLEASASKLQRVLELKPDHGQALFLLGAIRLEQQHPHEAIPLLEASQHYAIEPTETPALLAQAYNAVGRYAEALPLIQKAMALQPNNARFCLTLGEVLANLGHLQEARLPLHQALTLDATLYQAYVSLGQLECDFGNMEQGFERFNEAKNHAEGRDTYVLDRLVCIQYLRLADYPTALPLLQHLLEKNPNDLELLFWNCLTHVRLGLLEEGLRLTRKFLTDVPNHEEGLHLLAILETHRGNLTQALAMLNDVVAFAPHRLTAYLDIGLLHYALGASGDELINYFRPLFRKYNHEPVVVLGYAWALLIQGDYKECDKKLRLLTPNELGVSLTRFKALEAFLHCLSHAPAENLNQFLAHHQEPTQLSVEKLDKAWLLATTFVYHQLGDTTTATERYTLLRQRYDSWVLPTLPTLAQLSQNEYRRLWLMFGFDK